MAHWPHAEWLFTAEFFVFAVADDGETEEQDPGGMQDMFRFVEEEYQHQCHACHADGQSKENGVQSSFKPIRVFQLLSYFGS